jgi:hypothetical protein
VKKVYLGDGVYGEWDGYHVILTAENCNGRHNTIFLEEPVISALNTFVQAIREERTAPHESQS